MVGSSAWRERSVTVPIGELHLNADLTVPDGAARGMVLFAHGSGSSRLSPRNRSVAGHLVGDGFVTVLLDLLTEEEDRLDRFSREYRFDIPLLADRLVWAADWLAAESPLGQLPLGLFGASTGAAAALIAAAERRSQVGAVVSRGGRPDLAESYLAEVEAPTLLIVGGQDHEVLDLNRRAASMMSAPVEIEVVPGATHLFEEPGTLERVAELASQWFVRYLEPPRK